MAIDRTSAEHLAIRAHLLEKITVSLSAAGAESLNRALQRRYPQSQTANSRNLSAAAREGKLDIVDVVNDTYRAAVKPS